jgi:hypothetical protein
MIYEARMKLRELHPDTGGDATDFHDFIQALSRAKRTFARNMEPEIEPIAPTVTIVSTRKVTSSAHRRLRQAIATRRRRANPEYRAKINAARRAHYHRLKALGIKPKHDPERARRYWKRHPERVRASHRKYRLAHPEKVRQWKANEKRKLILDRL